MSVTAEIRNLALRLAREDTTWGYRPDVEVLKMPVRAAEDVV